MRETIRAEKPPVLTPKELRTKIDHILSVLDLNGLKGILFVEEGVLRWLTGLRHQIIDIAPDAESPVRALVRFDGSGAEVLFAADATELPRLKAQLPPLFDPTTEIRYDFSEEIPSIADDTILTPLAESYKSVIEAIVGPLLKGWDENQYKKLSWLSSATHALLVEAAHTVEPGMDGSMVKGVIQQILGSGDIETNLVLVGLEGQEAHLHPLYSADYRVPQAGMIKLVVGARYAEMIFSHTVTVNFGGPLTEEKATTFEALQEAARKYADCYRAGVSEAWIYKEISLIFEEVGAAYWLSWFKESAYYHHLGGPTSPLGNRDYLIQSAGNHILKPWQQFAVNPVETKFNMKVEMQGIILPDDFPRILPLSRYLRPEYQGSVTRRSTRHQNVETSAIIQR
jgi:Xaa-Pro aminopeptidase